MKSETRSLSSLLSVFVALFAVGSGPAALAADTSQTIAFSNCDTSLGGTADLRLRLFDASVAGNLIYEESQLGVPIDANGCFSVSIGTVTPLTPAPFIANPSLWIAFAADSTPDSELGRGRVPVTANGYAFRAKVADNAQTLPPGSVITGDQSGPGLTIRNPNLNGSGLQTTAGNIGVDATGGLVGAQGHATSDNGSGLSGVADGVNSNGVMGLAQAASGVNYGVLGQSSSSTAGSAGVYGRGATTGNTFGVIGESPSGAGGRGVWGKATATSGDAIGVYGESASGGGFGVLGTISVGTASAGVRAISTANNGNGIIAEANNGTAAYAIWGKSIGGFAGYFDGKVQVNGNMAARVVQITGGADLSEKFEIGDARSQIQPGMVVVIDAASPGKLALSTKAHDRRVAGVLSGAGGVAPGMLMGQSGTIADGDYPVALSGRVYVWVDASRGPVLPGDLLTTSNVPGHAMKVSNHADAQGAILGKAMTGLASGRGLVLVLVTLQ
jgi:hypothetical protein